MLELLWIKSLFNFGILLLAGLLMFFEKQKPRSRASVYFLTALATVHTVELLLSILWIREVLPATDVWLFFSFCLQLALGPLLLFSIQNLPFKAQDLLHFVPLTVVALFLPGAQALPREVLFYVLLFSQFHFVIYCGLLLHKGSSQWMKYVLAAFISARVIRFSEFILWTIMEWIGEPTAWILYVVAESIFVSGLAKWLLEASNPRRAGSNRDADKKLPPAIQVTLERELVNYLSKPSVYSDPLLSVKKVADHFKVASHHISIYLNAWYGQSFLEIVNEHRINACMKQLENPENRELSIQEVFYSAGFNSKSVFNTVFKKRTGLTPSEFRKKASLAELQTQESA